MSRSSPIRSAADRIADRTDDATKLDLALALRDSLKFDTTSREPQPKSPKDLEELYGVSIETQVEYGISLTKKMAVAFLNDYGKSITQHQFNRKFTASRYKSFYGRKVNKVGDKTLVFTYAEVQQMLPFGNELKVPKSISDTIKRLG